MRPRWMTSKGRQERQRRRALIGTFREPEVRPLASINDVVADGVTLTLSAVRLSVKNHLIVSALRDRRDFDLAEVHAFARDELLRLAEESEETAVRLDESGPEPDEDSDRYVRRVAREDRERRPAVQRALAVALRDLAADEDVVSEIARTAQENAAQEMQRALSSRLIAQRFDLDPEYERERATRIRALIAIDLERLSEPPSY